MSAQSPFSPVSALALVHSHIDGGPKNGPYNDNDIAGNGT